MRKLHLNNEQETVIKQLLIDCSQQLLAVSFRSPEDDQASIRRAVALKARHDLLYMLLADEFPDHETQTQPDGE